MLHGSTAHTWFPALQFRIQILWARSLVWKPQSNSAIFIAYVLEIYTDIARIQHIYRPDIGYLALAVYTHCHTGLHLLIFETPLAQVRLLQFSVSADKWRKHVPNLCR